MLDKSIKHFLFLITLSFISQTCFAFEFLDEQRNINYTQFKYEASKLLLTLGTDVTLTKKSLADVAKDLVTPEDNNAITPASDSIYIVTTDSKFFGKHTRYTIWFDERTALLQWLREIRRGSKSNVKFYRFAENGYRDYRKDYDNEDYVVNLSEISSWASSFKTFPVKPPEGKVISETAALLYLVSQLKLQKPGDEASLLMYSGDQLIATKLIVEGKTKLDTDFNIVDHGNTQRINEKERSVIKVLVKPVDSQGNQVKDLEVMGLKGEISMYIDEATRLLLQISGEIDIAGDVDVKLKTAVKAP